MSKVYYLLGSPCSGKTTVSKILSPKYDMRIYSGDTHRFDFYKRADVNDHPYMTKKTNDFFEWSLEEMIEWERGVISEQTPMIIDELNEIAKDNSKIVFEGMLDINLLQERVKRENICYLSVSPQISEVEFYNRASHKGLLDNIMNNPTINNEEKNRRIVLRRRAAIEAFHVDIAKYNIVQFEREKYPIEKMVREVESYFKFFR